MRRLQRAVMLVSIGTTVARRIQQLAQESADGKETGGILLGRGPDDNGIVFVERAGDAGPSAVRTPTRFSRDLKHSRELGAAAWQELRAVWVGEWHTHLGNSSTPSAVDLRTYSDLLTRPDLKFQAFVSIIVVADERLGWESPVLWPWLLCARVNDDSIQA